MPRRQSPSPVRSPHPTRARQPDQRPALLAALRAAGRPLTVAEAAAAIGTAESTARFHLSMLVSAGRVERTAVRSGSAGRPSWQYAPARDGVGASSPDAYRELARVLAAELGGAAGAAAAAREAGRRWAATISTEAMPRAADPDDAVDALGRVLDDLGFDPDPPGDGEIVLRACPFEAVAREHRAVVCAVHLGLVEQAAATIGGGLVIEGLEPFRSERPLACAVSLRTNR